MPHGTHERDCAGHGRIAGSNKLLARPSLISAENRGTSKKNIGKIVSTDYRVPRQNEERCGGEEAAAGGWATRRLESWCGILRFRSCWRNAVAGRILKANQYGLHSSRLCGQRANLDLSVVAADHGGILPLWPSLVATQRRLGLAAGDFTGTAAGKAWQNKFEKIYREAKTKAGAAR